MEKHDTKTGWNAKKVYEPMTYGSEHGITTTPQRPTNYVYNKPKSKNITPVTPKYLLYLTFLCSH